MTTLATWIDASYNRSASNDPGKLALDAELIGHVNRVYQRFYALFAKARPDEASSTAPYIISGIPVKFTLANDTIAVTQLFNATGGQINLIPAHEKQRLWHMAPAMYRLGNSVITRGLGGDPVAGDTVTAFLLDVPATLANLTDVIDPRFPTRHHQLCIDSLALYLDTKDAGREPEEHAKIVAEYQTALSTFAAEYNLAPDALTWAHAPAERAPVSAP